MPRRRILVIDDHLDTAESLAVLMRGMGHEVQFAINGYAALSIAREFTPDVVFVDLRLPDFDGFELTRRMKREPRLSSSRFIAITGHGGDEQRERALRAGCEDFFLKPLDPSLLDGLIGG